jgi:phosphoglycerate kinase
MPEYLTLDDVDVKNKTVLLRIDVNVPYDEKTGKINDSDRLKEHAKTVRELSDRGAKLVLMAHQGRLGDPDCIHLDQHAKLLTKHMGKEIDFVDDIVGEKAKNKIRSLKPGQILLLDNVRFLEDETKEKSPEEHAKSQIAKNLAPLADIFVNDAFSAAHRSQASLVGFTPLIPSYAGRNMADEVGSLEGIFSTMKMSKYDTFIVGGAKPEEPLDVMKNVLKQGTVEKILTGGIVGQLFLMAKGYKLGAPADFIVKKKWIDYLPQAEELVKKYGDKIETPIDLAIDFKGVRKEISLDELPTEYDALDIGKETIKKYSKIIKESITVVVKGPLGKYEDRKFGVGTKKILEAVGKSHAISMIGGGNTLDAADMYHVDKTMFTHVSLGGGSLIQFLSGKPMPAIEALKKAGKRVTLQNS